MGGVEFELPVGTIGALGVAGPGGWTGPSPAVAGAEVPTGVAEAPDVDSARTSAPAWLDA